MIAESAALDLISRVDFLERLVYWCYNSEYIGVRGEVPRLLAWLVKNCRSFQPFDGFLSVKDAVRCVVEMISSNHAVMQNEAFYAINLLFVGCRTLSVNNEDPESPINRLIGQVIEADVGKHLGFVVSRYGEKMDGHSVDNLTALLEQMLGFERSAGHLKSSEVGAALGKIGRNPNVRDSAGKLEALVSRLSLED